jgi:outer membrane protein
MRRRNTNTLWRTASGALLATGWIVALHAQDSAALPAAPTVHLLGEVTQSAAPATDNGQAQSNNAPPADVGPKLTIEQAEQIAIRNNPNISVARLLALAQGQVTREVRSIEMPQATSDLEAVDAHHDSRITGGGSPIAGGGNMTSSRILDKAAAGLTVSQLITDFGRTHNLVLSAKSNAKAQLENERATELDITLAVDQAFYQALTAQAVRKVAQETVNQRQATDDQVSALTKSKIRSDLDLSFADVQLSQAKLLLLDAQNNEEAAMAALNNVLGSEQDQQYTLVDDTGGNPPPAPDDPEAMVQAAFTARPDLAALNDQYLSAKQYATAQRDLWMPTISAITMGGGAPVRDDLIQSSWYLGAGANVSIPVFNGFLYNADAKEAKYRAQAAQENVRNLRDVIARDVRTAVLNAQTAYQRIAVTQQLLNQANFALDLASARYKIGLSGIVDITQAQLNQTEAEIANTNARYSYQTALAVVRYEVGQ